MNPLKLSVFFKILKYSNLPRGILNHCHHVSSLNISIKECHKREKGVAPSALLLFSEGLGIAQMTWQMLERRVACWQSVGARD